ncbi:MAG TPA: hypothetical protein VIG24_11020 [Acidimicrobiia bacterium]
MKPTTSTGYNPDFDVDLRTGALGEHLVGTFWEELQRTGTVEVKVDRGAWRTGNHYVEVHQWDGERWKPSGLSTTKAEWWAVVSPSGQGFVVVRTSLLRELVRDAEMRTQPIKSERTNASAGRLVKMDVLVRAMMVESENNVK